MRREKKEKVRGRERKRERERVGKRRDGGGRDSFLLVHLVRYSVP